MSNTDQDGGRSPGSTIEDMTHPSSPVRADPDPRMSLQHALGDTDSQRNTPSAFRHAEMEDEETRTPGTDAPPTTSTSTSRRKKADAAGSALNSSIYSGNKVRHLKKDDGEPLWRKDIQYDFLKLIFENDNACFTNSYEPEMIGKQTFANLYIDAMARSSKTSKILRDKLLSEHEPAKNMAMVCLLVNLGRMNTTLNFFPEMRAQLRTYHAIPSLQAHQDPNSYKQLQDAPRLKSILKGASEDRPEPNSIEKIKSSRVPRTNPVNLIFVLAQFAPKITELHFPASRDFYDLIMRTNLSSKSRADAFLWLMWHYLESDFTEEGADENPFGKGVVYVDDLRNQGIPRLQPLTQDEEKLENVDSQEEIDYGQAKMRERKRIIEADQAAFQAEHGPPKRGPKPKLHLPPDDGTPAGLIGRFKPKNEDTASPATLMGRIRPKYESDMDSTRSTPPPRGTGPANMRIQSVLNTGSKGRGSLKHQIVDGSSPIGEPSGPQMRRARPLTAHQLAVERNRNQRVDYILSRGLQKERRKAHKVRKQEGAFLRAIKRMREVRDPFEDSESEESLAKNPRPFRERGFVGLVQLETEQDDFGEEMSAYAAAFRRMGRRLDRWEGRKDRNLGVMGTKRVAQNGYNERDNDETEDEIRPETKGPRMNSEGRYHLDEALDEMEKEILGLGSGEDPEEDLDDVDKELLGLGGDETEEEGSGMDID
ncbi:Ino eighty subunit 1 [Hyphodiscus hymeniophilus]|uniref:Ino eighty subunit 1 n=1 Tax=Hyphodiscus hymeniophilus TaxID=353542 RepID=A0A9P6SN01_9HELO|nr:Ino eighty subunit 1 [Hyphodiscus hymeniophilus]